jgi:hypothetical protein
VPAPRNGPLLRGQHTLASARIIRVKPHDSATQPPWL